MRTIAHLSDLHFGRDDPRIVEALVADLTDLAPSLVAVSGDVTERARVREFERARAFLARIPAPKIVVPGNHDIPRSFRGLTRPLDRYRAFITSDLAPIHADEELVVVGISTARSLGWKGGRVSWAQMEGIRVLLGGPGPARMHVLIAHHPFSLPDSSPGERVVGRAAAALAAFGSCGLDLVLTGHLHRRLERAHPQDFSLARSVLALHAGTALSPRAGREAASYSVVLVRRPALEVVRRVFTGERFEPVSARRFARTAAGWVPMSEPAELRTPPPA